MDLNLYVRVLWRFKTIVAAGLLLALALAFLSYVSVKFDRIPPSTAYRETEQWESLATVGVTSQSFDPGSVLTPETRGILGPPKEADGSATPREVDPAELTSFPRLNEITVQAMRLATSDAVMTIMERDGGPIDGALQTFPVTSGDSLVPFMTFSAVAATPEAAVTLNERHVAAFTKFFRAQQAEAGIPPQERVVIATVNAPSNAVLLAGRKKTRPIIVFLTVMTAVLGLCFILENLRPRVREVASSRANELSSSRARGRTRRRSA